MMPATGPGAWLAAMHLRRPPPSRVVEPHLSDPNLTYDDLRRIVELIKSAEQFSEFRLKVGAIEIELRRRKDAGSGPAPVVTVSVAAPTAPVPAVPPEPAAWPEDCTAIPSPMFGTFYRAAEPGGPAFVEVGQKVEPETTVCIIEVMKLLTSIPAGARGVIARVLVDDAVLVETGQPLFLLRPA
jgi:acetyl-CoA carboxylase biotin carboxyl carrier protein